MVRLEGNRAVFVGAVNVETVPALLPAGTACVRNGAEVIDFARVGEVDSSAVALALALLRTARDAGSDLAFASLPPAMVNLARLYAVGDLIAMPHAQA